MPGKVAHESQACHNENLVSESLFNVRSTPYPDWVVTIAFYSALHMVDAELASLGHPDIDGHDQRRKLIKEHLSSGRKNIRSLFETLYSDCRRARYECTMFNAQPGAARKTAQHSVTILKEIKDKL